MVLFVTLVSLNLLLYSSKGYAWNIINRRSVLNGVATGAGAVILGGTSDPAFADPLNALIPIGSGGMLQRPYEETSQEWKSPTTLVTKLGTSRICSTSLLPLQQSLSPFASQELYYAPFLFGSWQVESTLQRKTYPFGKDFVPSRSLIEGSPRNRNEQVGSTTSFEIHYFSLQTEESNDTTTTKVDLSNPQLKIIADRNFNTISMSRAYQQLTPVEEVGWDYLSNPTRLNLRFGAAPVSEDMRPLGQRRGEVYFTARQTESSKDGSTFCAAERSRSIMVGPGTVIAADQETITEFQMLSDGTIKAVSRIAVYLTPNPNSREGVLWQQVGGKAVAFFDYEWKMTRTKSEVCVATPRDTAVQCM